MLLPPPPFQIERGKGGKGQAGFVVGWMEKGGAIPDSLLDIIRINDLLPSLFPSSILLHPLGFTSKQLEEEEEKEVVDDPQWSPASISSYCVKRREKGNI